MTAARCAWWTGLVLVTVWCWTIGAPWWLAAPTVILVTGRAVAALRDWEAASRESLERARRDRHAHELVKSAMRLASAMPPVMAAVAALGATWRRAIANAADYEDARLSARMVGYEGDDLDDLMQRASVERRWAARPMTWKKTVMALIREDWEADR